MWLPSVIASTPSAEELVGLLGRDPEAAGGVLAVDDDEVGGELVAQAGQQLADDAAPGPPDDVADEEDCRDPGEAIVVLMARHTDDEAANPLDDTGSPDRRRRR